MARMISGHCHVAFATGGVDVRHQQRCGRNFQRDGEGHQVVDGDPALAVLDPAYSRWRERASRSALGVRIVA